MATALQKFREKYPEYNDIEDEPLAESLRQKYYPDMDPGEYRRQLGLPAERRDPEPTIADRIDRRLSSESESSDPLKTDTSSLLDLARDQDGPLQTYFRDWEKANSRGFLNNATRLAAERTTSLLGDATQGVGRMGEGLEEKWSNGQIVFGSDWGPDDPADGKFRVRYMNPQEFATFREDNTVENILTDVLPVTLKSHQFGGMPRNTTESIKRSYARGEIAGTIGSVFKFGMEQGITSIPDMLAVMGGPVTITAYVNARSNEIGNIRAENKGLEEGTFQENLEALPFAVGSALLEKVGVRGITGAFGSKSAEKVGQELLEAGYREMASRVATSTAVAAGTEAATEAFQEGVLEYLGEKLGTEAPMSWEDALERGFFGALGGATFGGVAGGTLALGGEATRALDERMIDRNTPDVDIVDPEADPEVIPDTDFDAEGNIVTVDPEVTETPQEPVDTPAPDPDPPQDAPRETPDEQKDETTTSVSDPEFIDNRLKRDVYRVNLAGMASELVPGGGITLVPDPDNPDQFISRTPSVNPTWFQELSGTENALSVREIQNATRKALNGERLGVRQARVIGVMLDTVTDERVDPANIEAAREMLDNARQARAGARIEAAAELGTALPDLDAYEAEFAGELFEESEYLPEMDAEARIVDELADQLDDFGEEVSERVAIILDGAASTAEAMTALEVLLNEQLSATPGPEGATAPAAVEPAAEAQTAAPITADQFQERYAQHIDLRGRASGESAANAAAISEEGFRSAFLNTFPISRDPASEAGFGQRFQPKTGDYVYLVPQSEIVDNKIRQGWTPGPGEVVVMQEGDASLYDAYVRTLAESAPETEGTAPLAERRVDAARREAFAQLSPAEQYEMAYTDALTGLGNRRAFDETLPHAAAVGSVDVDGLGPINDNISHNAGDALIRSVAEALSRTGLEAFRVGGDEFYILGDNPGEVAAAINKAKLDLAHQVLEDPNGKVTGIQFTHGVGASKVDADNQMESNKKKREANGTRSPKGVMPRGAVLYSKRPVMRAGAGNNHVGLIGKNGQLPMNPDKAYVLGNGDIVQIPTKPVRRKHIMAVLQRKFGLKIFQGRVKGRTTLGFYRPGHGEIRIKNHNDLEVTAHEVSHWLDDRHPWISQLYGKYKAEMTQVSYDKDLIFEGYAEFMRTWFTQDQEARASAPAFYDAWMEALESHPGIKDVALELQQLMHAWYLQGSRARLDDRYGKQDVSIVDRVRDFTNGWQDKLLQNIFDGLRPFKQIEREITGGVQSAAWSGYKALRLAMGANGVMQGVLNRGTVNWNDKGDLVFTGKGIKEVFAAVSDRMENMLSYMVARRAEELMEQGRENHIRPDEIQAGLELGRQDPELAEVFDEFQAFNDRMMDFYESSGILSGSSRKAIQEMNQNYVPFNRIIDSLQGGRVKSGGGSPFMRLKGGTQDIADIFESIVGNTAHLIHMSLINRGKENFYRMIDNTQNQAAGMYAAPASKDAKPVALAKDQVIEGIVKGLGLDMKWYRMAKTGVVTSDEEMQLVMSINQLSQGLEPMVQFWQHGQDPKGNMDFYFDRGEKKFYEIIDAPLMEAINHIGPQSHNLAVSILGGFANVLRRGTTITPTFQAKNFIRDTMNAFTLSKGQIVPAAAATKALVERIYNDEHYWEYMINGGGFASMADADGINSDRVLDTHKKIWDHLDSGLSAFEYANRIAEFKALREQGWTAREAALAGREISSDFAMRGSSATLRVLTIAKPFLNARLQGLYRNGRELASMEEGRLKFAGQQAFSYALRSLISITIPSLVLYMLNREDERYKMLPDYVRDLSWIHFTGEGEDDYVIIPKPFETGMLWGTVPERMIEYYYTNDEKELADAMLWMSMETFNLDLMPQAFQVWADLSANKNFTGAPIIPQYLENVEPSEQYRAYTSDAMIALGRKMNISPLKAEYIVRGHFGTLGTWALGVADMMAGDISNGGVAPTKPWQDNILMAPFVNGGPLKRTHAENHLYDMLRETQRVVNTVRIISQRSPERLEQYIDQPRQQVLAGLNGDLAQWSKDMREIKNAIDAIQANPDMDGDEKTREIDVLERAKNEISAAVFENINPEFVQELLEQAEADAIRARTVGAQ